MRIRGFILGLWLVASSCGFTAQATHQPTRHWAFEAVRRPDVPTVKTRQKNLSSLDRFLLVRLERDGLKFSQPTDRVTLLRRLSLDLIGLPPSVEELDAFVSDRSDLAYTREVERLLASPHYGERWGRHWLDAARYADSNGYEKDRAREMWHYRDWVLEAFNSDKHYDEFVIEQIAGDLIEPRSQDRLAATGFLRNSMINEEGAIDPEQFRMEAMFDRMDALGKSVLGLTINCAQCHDHKSDPLSQQEYYGMFAVLNDVDEFTAPFYSREALEKIEKIHHEIEAISKDLKSSNPDWEQWMEEWERKELEREKEVSWVELTPYEAGAPDGLSKLLIQPDRSLLAGGHRFAGGTWFVKARTELEGIAAVRLEVLSNGNLPMGGPGRGNSGLFALTEFSLTATSSKDSKTSSKAVWKGAFADYEQALSPQGDPTKEKEKDFSGPVALAIDGNARTAWTIDAGAGRRNVDRKAVFVLASKAGYGGGSELRFDLACRDEIGCFRLSVTTNVIDRVDSLPRAVRESLRIPKNQRTTAQHQSVFQYWRTTEKRLKAWNHRIDTMWNDFPERSGEMLAMLSRSRSRDTFLLKRGDWLQPGGKVEPSVPAFLNRLPESSEAIRLRFARWLVSGDSPTTARVLVNRVWQNYFGIGLVATSEDFGIQSEQPSHPELLDWLAHEFMFARERCDGESGDSLRPWSLKHLHRLIVHSQAYKQSSLVTEKGLERDPNNRLLARAPRLRVEGEIIRDIGLAASGLLNSAVGGPPVYSPAPAFLFVPPTSYMAFPWKDATGPDRYRRAFYTFRRRSTPYPMLQTFDTPNGDASCVRRSRSNTPLQALTSLNEPLAVECAQSLAQVMVEKGGKSDLERIEYGFRRVVARKPTSKEKGEMLQMLERQRSYIGEGWVSAAALSRGTPVQTQAEVVAAKRITPRDLAAYTVLARVILNLDEAITKD